MPRLGVFSASLSPPPPRELWRRSGYGPRKVSLRSRCVHAIVTRAWAALTAELRWADASGRNSGALSLLLHPPHYLYIHALAILPFAKKAPLCTYVASGSSAITIMAYIIQHGAPFCVRAANLRKPQARTCCDPNRATISDALRGREDQERGLRERGDASVRGLVGVCVCAWVGTLTR